jgi:hypothetical protein
VVFLVFERFGSETRELAAVPFCALVTKLQPQVSFLTSLDSDQYQDRPPIHLYQLLETLVHFYFSTALDEKNCDQESASQSGYLRRNGDDPGSSAPVPPAP